LDSRLLSLIEILLHKDYCTLDEFAQRLGVSTRTIRKDIKQLELEMKGIAELIKDKSKGYRLVIENEEAFRCLWECSKTEKASEDSPQSRLAFIIGRLMNHDSAITLDELAFEMNIGRTTLVSEMKKAKMSLSSYNLVIRGKPNKGIYLSGAELDLRFFILDNLYDYLYSHDHLEGELERKINGIVKKQALELSTRKKLLQFIIVMLDRLTKGRSLTAMKEKYMKLLETKEYQLALEIASILEDGLSIKIPTFEVLFITIPIAGRRTPISSKIMMDISISEDMIKLVHLIVEEIGFHKNIISENQAFFTDLEYHLTLMLNRLMFDLHLENPLLSDVKEKYPVAYKMAEIAGQVIEKEYHLKVPANELGYIAIYFEVLNSKNELKTKRLQRVAVVCGTGRGTSELVAMQLRRILKQGTKIDLFSEHEVDKETFTDYDIVFTTVDLDFETEPPLIRINEIFDEDRIEQEIEKVTFLHKFNIRNGGNDSFIIKALIDRDKFFILDSTKSYRKNVNFMVNELIAKGHLDRGFMERLRKRSEKGFMVFDQSIALPHTIHYQSSEIVLSAGVFPDPIKEDGKVIKLVFFLGLPEQAHSDPSLLVRIYDEIIQMAKDKTLIDRLSRSKNYEEFIAYLNQTGK